MNNMNITRPLLLILAFCGIQIAQAQIVDKIDGIVDKNIILRSEVESQMQLLDREAGTIENLHCAVFDQMLLGKLLVAQAVYDSVAVADEEVEGELNRKVDYYISVIGSQEKFEEYYDKSVDEIKEEFRADIRDQLIAQRMRQKVVGEIDVTPSEVRAYFETIPEDSLPFFNTEFELSQIVVHTQVNDVQKQAALDKAVDIRTRIANGEPFELFCELYTEDEASKATDCELGYMPRGTFVPEFEAAAWTLEEGEISEVVETDFGFHVIEVLDRRGELLNVRHILIQAKTTTADQMLAKNKLDSLRTLIVNDTVPFYYVVQNHSDDDYSRENGGVMLNPRTGGTILENDDMDPQVFFMVDTMEVGDITMPQVFMTDDNKMAYRIIRLDEKTPPHKANLNDDWDRIYEAAKANKQNVTLERWVKKKARKTYIHIDDRYVECENISEWMN